MNDDVIVGRKTPQTGAQIIVAPSSKVRMPGQQPKPLNDALHHTSGNVGVPTFAGKCESRCRQARLPHRAKDETRSSAGSILFGGKSRHAALLYIGGQLRHFLMHRNPAPFAARQGRFRPIDGRQYLQPPPLSFFPKQQRFSHSVFLTV